MRATGRLILFCLLGSSLLLAGCTSPIYCSGQGSVVFRKEYGQRQAEMIKQLAADIGGLPAISSYEADLLSKTAVECSAELAGSYRARPPAWFNNFLVRISQRERGLCCHWTEDLLARLERLELKGVSLHWGVAGYDTAWEHSCVVVTSLNQPFSSGIVLDAWRNSGELWWGPVTADSLYKWRPHPDDRERKKIRCQD